MKESVSLLWPCADILLLQELLHALLPVPTVASLDGLKWGLTVSVPLQLRSSINCNLWHTVDSQLIFADWNSLVPVDLPGNHSHDCVVSLP